MMTQPEESTYVVAVTLGCDQVSKDGSHMPMMKNELVYSNLPYHGMVAVENVFIEAIVKLGQLGINAAEAKGHGEALSALLGKSENKKAKK